MKTCLKKEFREFICNYKSWMIFLLVAILPTCGKLLDVDIELYFFLSLMLMAVCQYLFDSYLTDTKSKGAIFLHNIRSGFFKTFIIKIFFSSLFCFIVIVINWNYIKIYTHFFDLLWIIPLFFASAGLIITTAILAQGAETTCALISTSIIFIGTAILMEIENLVLKILISFLVALVFITVAYKIYNSKFYRVQI